MCVFKRAVPTNFAIATTIWGYSSNSNNSVRVTSLFRVTWLLASSVSIALLAACLVFTPTAMNL